MDGTCGVLPVQLELAGKAAEAYSKIPGVRFAADAIARCLADNGKIVEEYRRYALESIEAFRSKGLPSYEYLKGEIERYLPGHFIWSQGSARRQVDALLISAESNLSRYFPDIEKGAPSKRWNRQEFNCAIRDFTVLKFQASIMYSACSLDDNCKPLSELFLAFDWIASRLQQVEYDDQYLQCQIELLDDQRTTLEKTAEIIEQQKAAADAQTEIAKEAGKTNKCMLRLTWLVAACTVVTTLATLATWIQSCSIGHPDSGVVQQQGVVSEEATNEDG